MPKIFVSEQDTRSFLTPAYSHSKRDAAVAFAVEKGWDKRDDRYQHFTSGNATFQPRSHTEFDTSYLGNALSPREVRPVFTTVQRSVDAMPSYNGNVARHTCLMVEGPRTFYRHINQTRRLPPYYYRFANNDFACYAAWGRDAAFPLGHPLFEEGPNRVFVGKSGRGVLYTSVPKFNADLTISGYDTHLTLVEFRLLDRDPSRDAVIRTQVHIPTRGYGYDAQDTTCQELVLDPKKFDPLWIELAARARAGFIKDCVRMPKALEADLTLFREQMRKCEEDRNRPYGTSYRERITKMNWEEALRSVEEPWQLEQVIRAFDGSQFNEFPGHDGVRYNRVGQMMKQHTCTEARREQLRQMIENFVAPRDTLWNYAGD